MNILVTFNKNYLPYFISLMRSINDSNKNDINYYIFSNDITLNDIYLYKDYIYENNQFYIINIPNKVFKDAPISKRYPLEMYYRLLASEFLPKNIERILYLDPDIIVKGNLNSLYNLDFEDNLFIGCSNIKKFLTRFNQIKNGVDKNHIYINTGVMLINIKKLRSLDKKDEIFDFIKNKKHLLTLPDQDVLSAIYGDKIKLIDNEIYNFNDRVLFHHNLINKDKIDLNWIDKNVKIIHYLGKNKPWKKSYHGKLKHYYEKYKVI